MWGERVVLKVKKEGRENNKRGGRERKNGWGENWEEGAKYSSGGC